MSLERSSHPAQRAETQNSSNLNPTNLAVQQSLQEIFDDFSVFVSTQLRSQTPEDMD